MRIRRHVAVVVTLLLVCVGLLWYARPFATLDAIGIRWLPTLRRSHCAVVGRRVACTTDWPPTESLRSATLIDYDRSNRHILRAERRWMFDDSSHGILHWTRCGNPFRRTPMRYCRATAPRPAFRSR